MKHEHDTSFELEYADMNRTRPSRAFDSILRHLVKRSTPPRHASIQLLRRWHEERLKFLSHGD